MQDSVRFLHPAPKLRGIMSMNMADRATALNIAVSHAGHRLAAKIIALPNLALPQYRL